jgi:hypothetical protein
MHPIYTLVITLKTKIFSIFFVAFLIVLCINSKTAYSTSSFDAKSVALEFLEQIAGINMNSFTIVSINASTNKMPDLQHYETNVRIVIKDTQRQFAALIAFIDTKFWSYRLDLLSGELGTIEQSLDDSLVLLNRTIGEYSTYFNRSYSSEFTQMIWEALQTSNYTLEDDKSLLKIQHAENVCTTLEYTRVQWFQKINGRFTSSFRSSDASVSKTGLLTRLTDNMALYWVATTYASISKEKAIEIAMPIIQNYARKHDQEIVAVNATFAYVTDIESNRGDSFALFPQWNVLGTFDKIDEQSVSKYAVSIWADNGQAYHSNPQGLYFPNEISSSPLWPFAMAIIALLAISLFLRNIKRRQTNIGQKTNERAHLKLSGILLMSAVIFALFIPRNALAKTSMVLGSTFDVPTEEISADSNITNLIASYSSAAGYSAYNWYGSQTTVNNIHIAAYGNGQSPSISFYIGHGDSMYVWNGYYYEQQWFMLDNGGYLAWDKDIFPHSSCGNCKFAFLWPCHQAETIGGTHWSGTPYGMPYAWHHTTSLSSDGYASPDDGAFAFIGFQGASPFLTNDELGVADAGYHFLQHFYWASLYNGYCYSVNNALDYAAQMVFGTTFANCILRTGFNVDWTSGAMKVYGNGNNHISNIVGSGGGCPLLYAYNGSEYIYEGLLNVHNPNGTDVIRSHKLATTLKQINNAYQIRLVEHPLTHSYIDQVKLFAVTTNGRMIQLPLFSAIHSKYGNVLRELLRSDDIRTDTAANQVIDLKFFALRNLEIASFIFQIEAHNISMK